MIPSPRTGDNERNERKGKGKHLLHNYVPGVRVSANLLGVGNLAVLGVDEFVVAGGDVRHG
jgi:hypothetical protein